MRRHTRISLQQLIGHKLPFTCLLYKYEGKVRYKSIDVISECLQHDAFALQLFQKHLLKYLYDTFKMKPEKILFKCTIQKKKLHQFEIF